VLGRAWTASSRAERCTLHVSNERRGTCTPRIGTGRVTELARATREQSGDTGPRSPQRQGRHGHFACTPSGNARRRAAVVALQRVARKEGPPRPGHPHDWRYNNLQRAQPCWSPQPHAGARWACGRAGRSPNGRRGCGGTCRPWEPARAGTRPTPLRWRRRRARLRAALRNRHRCGVRSRFCRRGPVRPGVDSGAPGRIGEEIVLWSTEEFGASSWPTAW